MGQTHVRAARRGLLSYLGAWLWVQQLRSVDNVRSALPNRMPPTLAHPTGAGIFQGFGRRSAGAAQRLAAPPLNEPMRRPAQPPSSAAFDDLGFDISRLHPPQPTCPDSAFLCSSNFHYGWNDFARRATGEKLAGPDTGRPRCRSRAVLRGETRARCTGPSRPLFHLPLPAVSLISCYGNRRTRQLLVDMAASSRQSFPRGGHWESTESRSSGNRMRTEGCLPFSAPSPRTMNRATTSISSC